MRRKKRFTIIQIAFALTAVAILPVTAQAKPYPGGTQDRLGTSETPYLSQGVTSTQVGIGTSPDDRAYSRAHSLETTTPVVSDSGTTVNIDAYAVTGFGLALLLVIGGTGLAIRHTRKGRLSPA
jgi:hypothetical protein